MDPSTGIGAVSSALGATFRILEKGFEINAVDDQAKSVLKTVDQVSGQLKDATTLRRQKSSLFTKHEKRMIDDTIKYTEDAISLVATLVEPARVDLEVSGGRIRFPTRLLFVLRDSPRIQVCLTQLGIASQSLNRDLSILCSREGHTITPPIPQISFKPAPPSYEEVVFLTEQRHRNIQRRSSAMSLPATLNSTHCDSTSSPSGHATQEASQEIEDVDGPSGDDDGPALPSTPVSTLSARLNLGAASDTDLPYRDPRRNVASTGHGRQRSLRWLEARSR